jgi:diketogulonate reductase-like aldo/keto reductase
VKARRGRPAIAGSSAANSAVVLCVNAVRWALEGGYRHIGTARVGQTPAQVLSKSTHRERIAENGRIFHFELTDEELSQLDALDRPAARRALTVQACREQPHLSCAPYCRGTILGPELRVDVSDVGVDGVHRDR